MEGDLVKRGSDKDETIGSKRGRDHDDEKGNMGRLEKRSSGMVMMIDQEYEYSGDEMINGVKYEEEKTPTTPTIGGSGGLFNQFITNLVNNSPRSNNHQPGTDFFEGELEKNSGSGGRNGGEVGVEGGGGVINNFISNIFSSNSNGGGEVVDKDGDGGEVVENSGGGGGAGGDVVNDGGKKDGGGDIIDSIVAKLPKTLSGDIAPATDEASILIHSIIHD